MTVNRVAGIVVRDEQILLMFRRNHGKEYYTFPGGGIEEGESHSEALIREFQEETSIKITPRERVYNVTWDGTTHQYFYRAEYTSGEPALGDFVEKQVMRDDPEQYYEPRWVPLGAFATALVYPLEVRDLVLTGIRDGFPTEPHSFPLSLATARQDA